MILVKAGYVVTQNKKRQIIKDGAVLIKGDKIFDLGKCEEMEKKYKGRITKAIGGKNCVAMPGLINTHTHLAMVLLRGYADDLPLEEWWFKKIFPAEAKLKKEDIYLGSLLGGLEMIKSGTTCFADFYFFVDDIARAAAELGLRANIGIPIMDFEAPEFKNPEEAFLALPGILSHWKTNDLINFSLAPHMLQTASLETYKKCQSLAKKYNLLLQTHLTETKQEIKYALKKYKTTPAKLLIKNKILDQHSLAAHCCNLADDEIKLFAKTRASIAHCPVSNLKLVSGIMPLTKLLKAGINISLGTDSACSNNNLDLFEEMKTASLIHKISENNPASAKAQTILDMATINGAKALGMEKQIGSLEKGKKADIIVLDFNQPHLVPQYNIISNLVYSARGSDVETSLINGKIVMEKKKVLPVDERKILKKVKNCAIKLI
jgi:5-methylthioadenosine/S-adenosylhomocysteine deaminase